VESDAGTARSGTGGQELGQTDGMRFTAEHRFDGSPTAVAGLLGDPEFYLTLALPDLSQPVVLEHRSDGSISQVRLRYEFVGSLNPMARRLVGAERLAWIQEIRVDRSAGSGGLVFSAERQPGRLHGSASFVLAAQGDGTVRQLEGELVVAVALVGSAAERQIVPGLLRRLDIEAEGLAERLRAEA
jgi:Protein of unknown function (DUF2505)